MVNRPGLDFSFSGLKTYARNVVLKEQANGELPEQVKADIALAFERAVVSTLSIKCKRALEQTGYSRLVIAGGVSANQSLREELQRMTGKLKAGVYYARPEYCTDNGAMIALAGALRLVKGEQAGLAIEVRPRWPLDELQPLMNCSR